MSYRSAARREIQGSFPLGGENRNRYGTTTSDDPQPWSVQFVAHALDALAVKHELTPDAKWLLAWLVIHVSHTKPEMRCSAAGLAEWLRTPRFDDDQGNDRLARRIGGSLRRRLGMALGELDGAGLIEWTPGHHGHDGTLVVTCYELLAVGGRPDLGGFVPIYQDRLEEWCLKRRLDFEGRILLLRVLLNTNPESLLVARSALDLADKLDIGQGRAARLLKLDGDLQGALQRTAAGIETVVYWDLVAPVGRSYLSRNARPTRTFAQPSLDGPLSKRAPDQDFRATGSEPEFSPGSLETRASSLETRASSLETRARPGLLPPDLLPNYLLPCLAPTEYPSDASPEVEEARKEEACRNIGEQVFADLVATLGPYRHDLTSPANMASRQRLIGILDDRGRDGWALAELVECLTTNVVGVGSVMAVVLSRAKALTPPLSAAHLEEAEQRLEEERGARKIAGARTYGRNRVGVLSAAELEEDLVHRFEDPCLIEAARDAFNEHALKLHSAAPNVQESNDRLFGSSHSSQCDPGE